MSGTAETSDRFGLHQLLDPRQLANPYPLYRRLREEAPVQWDPYLHAWVCTRYEEASEVLKRYRAARTPTPEKLATIGMGELKPIAEVMVKQMLFLDRPDHTRVRKLAGAAFTPRRVAVLHDHIAAITERLISELPADGFELMGGLAAPLPAIVTAEMLGVPTSDHVKLKNWSQDFAEMLGNFQHNPGRTARILQSVEQMVAYFRAAVQNESTHPTEGLINALVNAEVDGDRFTEEEIIANTIVTMVGGQETTTNLIGNGMLTLLRKPEAMAELREDPELIPNAVEELLRYESPSQHTARLAPEGAVLDGHEIPEGAAVIAVMGAANRDPERFPDPDRLDLAREDNRHLAFGWAAHFCFGAPLARMEGQLAFRGLLERFDTLTLAPDQKLRWRPNLGLRGLTELHIAPA